MDHSNVSNMVNKSNGLLTYSEAVELDAMGTKVDSLDFEHFLNRRCEGFEGMVLSEDDSSLMDDIYGSLPIF